MYPNPANDFVALSVTDELPNYLAVYNTLGQLVKQVTVSSEADLTIDTQALAQGVYFIKVTKESASKTLQFVKE